MSGKTCGVDGMDNVKMVVTYTDGRRRKFHVGPEMAKTMIEALASGNKDYVAIEFSKIGADVPETDSGDTD